MPSAMIGAYLDRLPARIQEAQAALAGALLGGGAASNDGGSSRGNEHVSADAMLALLGVW